MKRGTRNSGAGRPTTGVSFDATSAGQAALFSRTPDLGWAAAGSGAAAGDGSADAGAFEAAGASGAASGACHVAGAGGVALVSRPRCLRRAQPGARQGQQAVLQGRRVLGADRPHPPDRRGGGDARAHAGGAGVGDPLRAGHQPGVAPTGAGLGASVSRPPSTDAAGSARRLRVRAPQPPQAPAGGTRNRPVQLGALVRSVGACPPASARPEPGCGTAHVARPEGLAPGRRTHRLV
jgi:hypothetical protein